METIILQVDEASAKAWNNSSPSQKAMFEEKINAILKESQEPEDSNEYGFTKEQLQFLKSEAKKNTEPYEWWSDEELVSELERRSADLKSGRDAGISWEDAKKQLMARLK